MKKLFIYFLTFFIFLFIDFLWLAFLSQDLYSTGLGNLLSENINLFAVFLFYIIFTIALVNLAILPGIEKKSLELTIFKAAIFGFASYATYDITNYATLKNWPVKIVIIDIIWGTSIASITSFLAYKLIKLIKH